MFNFNDWLNDYPKRQADKKEEFKIIENQMNEYFQPERLSEKTRKGSDSLNLQETVRGSSEE